MKKQNRYSAPFAAVKPVTELERIPLWKIIHSAVRSAKMLFIRRMRILEKLKKLLE